MLGYVGDLARWMRTAGAEERQNFPLRLLPTLSDKHAASGVASGHYFHQDLWVARRIYHAAPSRHIDVGSRIDGFIAHLLTFRDVDVLDIRTLSSRVAGLRFLQSDLLAETPLAVTPAPSVSSLHALEHFGLGRYGDPIRPDGWRIGLRRLSELVEPGGRLYIGVPVGKPAVEFNAQRIFDPRYILNEAEKLGLKLVEMACVDDTGDLHEMLLPCATNDLDRVASFDYGCGLFVFVKSGVAGG